MIPTPSSVVGQHEQQPGRGGDVGRRVDDESLLDSMKRPLDHHHADMGRVPKKMRMEETLSIAQ